MLNPATHDELRYTIALSLIPQIGPGVFKNIISYCSSAKRFLLMPAGRAEKIPGIGPKLLSLRNKKDHYIKQAEAIINDCLRMDIQIHTYLDENYPKRFRPIFDSPVFVFSKGNINLNPNRTIGIIGTRNATDYGKSITRKIVEDLAPYEPTVISGLAYGIDIETHRAALQFDLPTIGVLGTSLDNIYPASHKTTAAKMMENGGLVSEYPVGSDFNKSNFPQRNRIIAALSDALIIVEAAVKGGALITAEIAYSYNKETFAVPGNLHAKYSEGCNNLIRTMRAGIYMGPKELEDALSWNKEDGKSATHPPPLDLSTFEPEERMILELILEQKELEIDKISWLTKLPQSILAAKLLSLEFQGIIRSVPGKKFRMA